MKQPDTSIKHRYSDSMASIWMAKHHGMKFKSGRDSVLYYDGGSDFRVESTCEIYVGEYYYIHPENLHLLEPQEDDLIQIGDDIIFWVCSNDSFWEQHKDEPGLKYNFIGLVQATCFFDDAQARIIQRNGKPYFWPESNAVKPVEVTHHMPDGRPIFGEGSPHDIGEHLREVCQHQAECIQSTPSPITPAEQTIQTQQPEDVAAALRKIIDLAKQAYGKPHDYTARMGGIAEAAITATGEWHSADSSLKGTAKSIQCESESPDQPNCGEITVVDIVSKAIDANDSATTSQEGLAAATAIIRPYLRSPELDATSRIGYTANEALTKHISRNVISYDSFADYKKGFFDGYENASIVPVVVDLEKAILAIADVQMDRAFDSSTLYPHQTRYGATAIAEAVMKAWWLKWK